MAVVSTRRWDVPAMLQRNNTKILNYTKLHTSKGRSRTNWFWQSQFLPLERNLRKNNDDPKYTSADSVHPYNTRFAARVTIIESTTQFLFKIWCYSRRPPIICLVRADRPTDRLCFFVKSRLGEAIKLSGFFFWWQVLRNFRHGVLTQNPLFGNLYR